MVQVDGVPIKNADSGYNQRAAGWGWRSHHGLSLANSTGTGQKLLESLTAGDGRHP